MYRRAVCEHASGDTSAKGFGIRFRISGSISGSNPKVKGGGHAAEKAVPLEDADALAPHAQEFLISEVSLCRATSLTRNRPPTMTTTGPGQRPAAVSLGGRFPMSEVLMYILGQRPSRIWCANLVRQGSARQLSE